MSTKGTIRVTVSSEQTADSCEQHIIAVKRPNIRPSSTISRDITRVAVGESSQSAQMSNHNNVQLLLAVMYIMSQKKPDPYNFLA